MCFVHSKFRLNRLRRWPSSSPIFSCRTSLACMKLHWRRGRLHTPIAKISTADCPKLFSTLLLISGRIVHTKHARFDTPHTWEEICSHSPNASISLGCLFLPSIVLRYPHFLAACSSFETKFVERARLEHLDAVVHLQMSPGSLFAGGPTDCFDRSPSSCRLPPTDRYNKQVQNPNRQGGYAETHDTQTVAAEQQEFPATSSQQTNQMIQCIVPAQRQI